jgi:D-alanine--poly(phosphoribitol) ligase subunit 2
MDLNNRIGARMSTALFSSSFTTPNHRESVAAEVADIFSQKLQIDVPSYDTDLFEEGILDSLQLIELLFELEKKFGVRISLGDTDLENLRSIERIALTLSGI